MALGIVDLHSHVSAPLLLSGAVALVLGKSLSVLQCTERSARQAEVNKSSVSHSQPTTPRTSIEMLSTSAGQQGTTHIWPSQ